PRIELTTCNPPVSPEFHLLAPPGFLQRRERTPLSVPGPGPSTSPSPCGRRGFVREHRPCSFHRAPADRPRSARVFLERTQLPDRRRAGQLLRTQPPPGAAARSGAPS